MIGLSHCGHAGAGPLDAWLGAGGASVGAAVDIGGGTVGRGGAGGMAKGGGTLGPGRGGVAGIAGMPAGPANGGNGITVEGGMLGASVRGIGGGMLWLAPCACGGGATIISVGALAPSMGIGAVDIGAPGGRGTTGATP